MKFLFFESVLVDFNLCTIYCSKNVHMMFLSAILLSYIREN